ncbi:TrmH family RNA methyltransferase [Marinospirillum perlucidum]|uniref:TrmH family RNA methyltransferase n=1 Tax=Marinospirillum perlucidum TaxID=1982602 RepID=UPI000DF4569D|nr:RNA methyltransferase [Marinospirillum perlucidum]
MISKNQAKLLRSLHKKKYRREQGLFLVEGEKTVLELLASGWPLHQVFATPDFIQRFSADLDDLKVVPASAQELTQLGTLVSNQSALAVAIQPEPQPVSWQAGNWILALDRINDPGNLGTILRIADWYGIQQLVCSPGTAEVFNPKVITASKGSFLRVKVSYQPLDEFMQTLPEGTAVLGAYLEGENIHDLKLEKPGQGGIVVMGSEAQGIAPELEDKITQRVTLPGYGQAESLNVGVATALICDNLRRLEGG